MGHQMVHRTCFPHPGGAFRGGAVEELRSSRYKQGPLVVGSSGGDTVEDHTVCLDAPHHVPADVEGHERDE